MSTYYVLDSSTYVGLEKSKLRHDQLILFTTEPPFPPGISIHIHSADNEKYNAV